MTLHLPNLLLLYSSDPLFIIVISINIAVVKKLPHKHHTPLGLGREVVPLVFRFHFATFLLPFFPFDLWFIHICEEFFCELQ